MNNPAAPLAMTDGHRQTLQSIARSQTAPYRLLSRSQALLLAADGIAYNHIAAQVGVSVPTIRAWRTPFAAEGLRDFGKVAAGRGRQPIITDDKIDEMVRLTQRGNPQAQTHWSCRTMAKATGVSSASVQRIWSSRGLKPHRVRTFKLSNDPKFDALNQAASQN